MNSKIKLPSDFLGITPLLLTIRSDNNYQAAVSTACMKIRDAIRGLGPIIKKEEMTQPTDITLKNQQYPMNRF